jgi:hypothetical protein
MSTKRTWTATARALLRELAEIALFSEAAKRRWIVEEEQQKDMVKAFVRQIMRHRRLDFAAYRPRFTLATLRHLVRKAFDKPSHRLEWYVQRLLGPYLGPDGW